MENNASIGSSLSAKRREFSRNKLLRNKHPVFRELSRNMLFLAGEIFTDNKANRLLIRNH